MLDLSQASSELRFVLQAVASRWGGERAIFPVQAAPSTIMSLIKHHRLAPFVFEGALELPPDFSQALQRVVTVSARRSAVLALETARICEHFQKAQFPILVIKGAPFSAQLYGNSTLRSCRDVDLLCRPSDWGALIGQLDQLGYEIVMHSLNAVAFRHRVSKTVVDMHAYLAEQDGILPLSLFRPFERQFDVPIGGVQVPTLSPEWSVLYAAYHGTRHLWSELAWVADMAAATRLDLDWDRMARAASVLGIRHHLGIGLKLAEKMFGLDLPTGARRAAAGVSAHHFHALSHLTRTPALDQRRVVAEMGIARFVWWEMRLFGRWSQRLGIFAKHCSPSDTDRGMLRLPKGLGFLYPVLRGLRVLWGMRPWNR